MKNDIKKIGVLDGLRLIKNQWNLLAGALIISIFILALDFFLTLSIPIIIDELETLITKDHKLSISLPFLIISSLIIIRPLIAWIINYIQISIILTILRRLENEILAKSNKIFVDEKYNYSSENSANMLISHGRYFVDNFLIPLIRAITDTGVILAISFGIFIQYPLPLIFFLIASFSFLLIYQLSSKNLLRRNGEICLRCYEEIITSSNEGFSSIHECNQDDLELKNKNIYSVLNRKKSATIIIGSISQGIKYVVEFCFMFSFGIAAMSMILLSPDKFTAFVTTFAYAGIRMLPSLTSIISFYQTKSVGEQAVSELINHIRS